MVAKQVVVKLTPYKEGQYPGVFTATVMDPSLEIGGGPIMPGPGWPDEGPPPWGIDITPRPEHPICLPGMGCWVEPPPGGGAKPTGLPAVIYAFPANVPPPPVPEGMPSGTAVALVVFPGEKVATVGYFLPYPSTGPVPVPEGTAPKT